MYRYLAELKSAWRRFGGGTDEGVWIQPGAVFVCSYPHTDTHLTELATLAIHCVVNLHTRAHKPETLTRCGLTEHHFPTPDFQPPTPVVLLTASALIQEEVAAGHAVAIHCGGGLGRTGTLVACYLLHTDAEVCPKAAIQQVRSLRPGAIETPAQEQAVMDFAACLRQKSP